MCVHNIDIILRGSIAGSARVRVGPCGCAWVRGMWVAVRISAGPLPAQGQFSISLWIGPCAGAVSFNVLASARDELQNITKAWIHTTFYAFLRTSTCATHTHTYVHQKVILRHPLRTDADTDADPRG